MDNGRADEYYMTDEGLLINLEEESGEITKKTLRKFAKYVVFACDRYNGNVYLAVLCHKNPKKDFEYFMYAPSIIIKVHYYYFSQEELWDKYENVINKVKQKEELSESEALDIAFVSKFISKEYVLEVLKSLTKVFKESIIEDKILKMDVGVILGAMVLKHVKNVKLQNKLLGDINMGKYENELHELVYDEFGDVLNKKDEELVQKDEELVQKDEELVQKDEELVQKDEELVQKDEELVRMNEELVQKDNEIDKLYISNNEYKNKIMQLNELDDLNSLEAKRIIDYLLSIGG